MSDASSERPVVGIVMGSDSDWPIMEAAAEALTEFGVPHEVDVVSAHRMPLDMLDYGRTAADRGLRIARVGRLQDRIHRRPEIVPAPSGRGPEPVGPARRVLRIDADVPLVDMVDRRDELALAHRLLDQEAYPGVEIRPARLVRALSRRAERQGPELAPVVARLAQKQWPRRQLHVLQ